MKLGEPHGRASPSAAFRRASGKDRTGRTAFSLLDRGLCKGAHLAVRASIPASESRTGFPYPPSAQQARALSCAESPQRSRQQDRQPSTASRQSALPPAGHRFVPPEGRADATAPVHANFCRQAEQARQRGGISLSAPETSAHQAAEPAGCGQQYRFAATSFEGVSASPRPSSRQSSAAAGFSPKTNPARAPARAIHNLRRQRTASRLRDSKSVYSTAAPAFRASSSS